MFSTRPYSPRRRRRDNICALALVFLFYVFIDASYLYSSQPTTLQTLHAPRSREYERVFIASIHWNNEEILKSHWNNAVLHLSKHLGPANVFVAVLESGSWDGSKSALRELGGNLTQIGVKHWIELEEISHRNETERVPAHNETGWIQTPRGRKERRRISYLADLRNRVTQQMLRQSASSGITFDKVLWLNDVVFTTEDVLTLLDTRQGDYAAACSMDFAHPPHYYDTFALRDAVGRKTSSQTWPYFAAGTSRDAMMSSNVIPVQSCWNGMVAMDARPFYGPSALQFRGLHDGLAASHLEASECCLIHADNPLREAKGIWINPNIRVGYNMAAYHTVNAQTTWPFTTQRVIGRWKLRWLSYWTFWSHKSERHHIHTLSKQWSRESSIRGDFKDEIRQYCIVNEMQVLTSNGWAHV